MTTPRELAEDALRLDQRYQDSGCDPNYAYELSKSSKELATALLAALDRVEALEGYITEQIEKEIIPIRPGIDIEGDNHIGTFACNSSYEDGPKPKKQVGN